MTASSTVSLLVLIIRVTDIYLFRFLLLDLPSKQKNYYQHLKRQNDKRVSIVMNLK